jgi:hypothetical protein
MWKRLSESLHRTWLMLNRSAYERRAEKARARFWLEVREGQREAEIAIRSDLRTFGIENRRKDAGPPHILGPPPRAPRLTRHACFDLST